VSNYFKKLLKSAGLFTLPSDDVMSGRNQTFSLFVIENGVKFNIWDVVSTV